MSTFNEPKHRVADATDRARTEMNLALRKYVRRISDEVKQRIELEFSLNPDADPDRVAIEAWSEVGGRYGIVQNPQPALEHGAS